MINDDEDNEVECSILNDTCPYSTITCLECEVHCSVERAKKKLQQLKEVDHV